MRNGQPGLYPLADFPQRPSLAGVAKSTGWPEMDELLRFYPGQFIMVTGKANHGKSTFVFNLICNAYADHKIKSFLYVPENEDYVRDELALIWGSRQGWDAFANVGCFLQTTTPDAFDQEPKTLNLILELAEWSVVHDGVKLVVIDPFNELELARPKDMLPSMYYARILQHLKAFARKHGVTVILTAHPTKQGAKESRVVDGYDTDGGAMWINKSDNFLVVVRDHEKNLAEVWSQKVRLRGAGRRGVCHFFVDEDTGIFTPQKGAVSL